MESFCRLCCASHEVARLNHLFDEENSHLLEKLNHFAGSTLKIDVKYILYICIRCTELLQAAYEFKLLCESAEAKFLAVNQSNNPKLKEEVLCSPDIDFESKEIRDESLGFLEASNPSIVQQRDVSRDIHMIDKANYKRDGNMESPKLNCDVHKTNKIDLTKHMKVHRTSEPTSKRSPDNGNGKRPNRRQAIGSKLCDICSSSFCRKRELEQHMKTVHHLPMTNNSKPIVKPWICETCGKEYKSKRSLKYHINGAHVAAVVKDYSCNLCDYKCREARNLASHRLVHSGEKLHQCSECGASFGFPASLHRHIQCVHRREMPHKCTICNQSFYTKLRLNEHSFVHTGQHPYQCTLCSRTYRYTNSLCKHMRKCHKDATET